MDIALRIETELRKRRISELEILIAQSNTKLKYALIMNV